MVNVAEKTRKKVRVAATGTTSHRARLKLGTFAVSEAELVHEIEQARQRTATEDAGRPVAIAARYEPRSRRLLISLENGCAMQIPVSLIEGLSDATSSQRSDVRVIGHGTALEWQSLDLHLSVEGLMSGLFGTRKWMAR